MKLGWSEWWLMNNPLRPLMQKHFELHRLLRMGGARPGALALEIGCGGGRGIDLLYRRAGVRKVHAFDLDKRMVRQAAAHQRGRSRVSPLWVGHADRIPVADATYDAVFDFGVLHHIRHWQPVLGEVHRVLRPGGRFYIEEITRRFIVHPIWRRLLDHPQENRFDLADLVTALENAGFEIHGADRFAGLFIWCIADKPSERAAHQVSRPG